MFKYIAVIFLFYFFISCTPKKPEQKSPILTLHEIGKLATAEYLITKIVKANDNATWYKIGDRKMLISCKASIKAGVDFAQITEKDITTTDKKIEIRLPPAQIISLSIVPEDVKVEYEEVGLFRDPFTNAERDYIMQQAEKQIRSQADRLNILATATNNASAFVRTLFTNAGFEEVSISYR